jgi:hypothetical protein
LLERDELRLVPLPNLDADEFVRITTDAERILPHEVFRPGGAAGIVVRRFPYTLSLARVSGQYRVQAVLRGVPSYAPFYDADHPSGALAVTIAILDAFHREARARAVTVVPLIPDIADLEHAEPDTRFTILRYERALLRADRSVDAAPGRPRGRSAAVCRLHGV